LLSLLSDLLLIPEIEVNNLNNDVIVYASDETKY